MGADRITSSLDAELGTAIRESAEDEGQGAEGLTTPAAAPG